MQVGNSDSLPYKFILSFNDCRINKRIINFLSNFGDASMGNTLAKYLVLSVTNATTIIDVFGFR